MKFITFEGCEACGKTTQAKILKKYIEELGYNTCLTREPGGTVLSENIRSILLDSQSNDPLTEYLLLAAARRDHVLNLIKPNLEKNIFVISDRFYDSSIVYQGFYKKLDYDIIEKIKKITIGQFQPDLTFLFDIPPNIIKKRLKKRNTDLSHYDNMGIDFHTKIREGFLKLANIHKDRIVVIDSTLSIDQVSESVKTTFKDRFRIMD